MAEHVLRKIILHWVGMVSWSVGNGTEPLQYATPPGRILGYREDFDPAEEDRGVLSVAEFNTT